VGAALREGTTASPPHIAASNPIRVAELPINADVGQDTLNRVTTCLYFYLLFGENDSQAAPIQTWLKNAPSDVIANTHGSTLSVYAGITMIIHSF
jgi:hypothetical protein